MSEVTVVERPPEPDFTAMTEEELVAYQEAENRWRAADSSRAILGERDPCAAIDWREVALPDRRIPVRVYRPSPGGADDLPLVLHVHGSGFVGTATQSDWINSHLAARLPAVVVSVEHRLLAPRTPLSAAADDGWEVLRHVVEHAARWGVDPERAAVFGESTGALISALAAIRAGRAGPRLRAQVLVNPLTDVTGTMFDHPSMAQHAHTPTLAVPQLRLLQRLAVPPGTDPRPVSPLYAEVPDAPAPALVLVPTRDPLADHGRRYAERLRAAGTSARLIEYPGAGHAFLSLPGVPEQAEAAHAARADILRFLRAHLTAGDEREGTR
ncbi:alpha/beta hydrolase [Bailinhaonella thermotolerans]|uniref:Alpha/beta hydrolase n=1 Tax=Bailinhaonella thermotolerans TaxID=1070861 RepID=A0A3A4B0K1_9ACTN|nr:alpha/beta hydrolase [Bailinhaonella thermotolerans]